MPQMWPLKKKKKKKKERKGGREEERGHNQIAVNMYPLHVRPQKVHIDFFNRMGRDRL